jgi:predicted permease
MSFGERVFSVLLLTYPTSFRRRYREDLLAFFRADQKHAKNAVGFAGFTRFWSKTLFDLARAATSERLAAFARKRGAGREPHRSPTRGPRRLKESIGMGTLVRDFHHTVRMLIKNPGLTTIAVLSLALGIGANTAIFSVYSSVFLRKLPVEDPESVVDIYTNDADEDAGLQYGPSSYADFVDWREHTQDVFEGMVLYNVGVVIRDTGDESEFLFGEEVTADYFAVLGVRPALGRAFVPEDGAIGASPTVVIGHSFWKNRLGGTPDVVGETIRLSGHNFTIIGVAPEEFNGLFPLQADVWYPITLDPLLHPGSTRLESRGSNGLWIKGRLKAGVTPEQARAALAVVSTNLAEVYPETNSERRALLLPTDEVALHPQLDGVVKGFTLSLMAMVGLVLLIACTNLASMLLAHALARRREIGIRLALGAGRLRLIRQLLTESTTLAVLGGVAGLALAHWLIQALLAVQPPIMIPIHLNIGIDGTVLVFALAVSLATGVIFGLVPALKSTRPDLVGAVKDEYGFVDGRLRRIGLRSVLVVAQVAVSAVLLVCAGLFLRSLGNASNVDTGFTLREGVVATLPMSESGYGAEESRAFFEELEPRIATLPGVLSVAYCDRMPLGQSVSIAAVYPETPLVQMDEDGVGVDVATVSPDYFQALGIPVLFGRAFDQMDSPEDERVVIVNNTFARTYWPGESAIGKQVRVNGADEEPRTIIGVAKDGKYRSLGEAPRSFLYLPYVEASFGITYVAVASSIPGTELVQPVRRVIRELDSHLPIVDLTTVSGHMELMLFLPRALAAILAGLGLLALILGTTGLYGVIAYDVSRRTREIGIRMSVGAEKAQVLRLVIGDGLKLVGIGTATGLLLAFLCTRFVESMLFNINPVDPITFVAVTLLFLGVSIAATLRPALRASSIDPVNALRYE